MNLFKNDFLNDRFEKIFERTGWKEIEDIVSPANYYWVNGFPYYHGACYARITAEHPVNNFMWVPPANTTLSLRIEGEKYENDNYKGTEKQRDSNRNRKEVQEYIKAVYFSEESPWSDLISCLPEMFEGYESVEERAELMSYIGIIPYKTAFENLSVHRFYSAAIFWRRQFEFLGVRDSLKTFLDDEQTSKLPLRWNIYLSQIVMTKPGTKEIRDFRFDNWHNAFNPSIETAVVFIKHNFKPLSMMEKKEENSWKESFKEEYASADQTFNAHFPKYKKIGLRNVPAFNIKNRENVVDINLRYWTDYLKEAAA